MNEFYAKIKKTFGFTNNGTYSSMDEAEVCAVVVDSLRCAICYEIYNATPQSLQCGHSFCSSCIAKLTTPYCPLCRKEVNLRQAMPNYALKTILDGTDELSKDEEKLRRSMNNTMSVSNKQLRLQCIQFEQTVGELKRDINTIKELNNRLRLQCIQLEQTVGELNRDINDKEKTNIGYSEYVLIAGFLLVFALGYRIAKI